MSKIIVTGANGQLGSEIKTITKLYPNHEFIFTDVDTLDLTNEKDVSKFIESIQPNFLINCAAYTAVDKAEEDTSNAEKINATVPQQIAYLAQKHNFKLIHISTDYVYSGKQYQPLTEINSTDPASVYGKTKLLGEDLVFKATDAIVIRTSWLYSIFGNNFVKSMLRLGTERDKLGVVFDQIGSPTNAADLAQALIKIIEQFLQNNIWHSVVYHYSNEGVCSWYDFAYEIMQLAKLECKINPILSNEYPLPAPRPAFSVMNKQKIKDTFNFDIPNWKASLSITINELLKQS